MVYLQHKVREMELELDKVENEDGHEDPEAVMRSAAAVRMHDTSETKFLGSSSGIAITRLVMQLAKQFTDARSINDIVPDAKARQIKDLYAQEQAKPTSKVYPLTSNVAAEDLPNKSLTDLLVQLYNLKGTEGSTCAFPNFANDRMQFSQCIQRFMSRHLHRISPLYTARTVITGVRLHTKVLSCEW